MLLFDMDELFYTVLREVYTEMAIALKLKSHHSAVARQTMKTSSKHNVSYTPIINRRTITTKRSGRKAFLFFAS